MTTSSQESVASAATKPQANISSMTSFPMLNQPFIAGPGFSPVPAKVVGQVVVGKFIDLGDLLPSTGKWCLIVDLSSSGGASVSDGINTRVYLSLHNS